LLPRWFKSDAGVLWSYYRDKKKVVGVSLCVFDATSYLLFNDICIYLTIPGH
jgi:hypothetical protein